MKKLLLTAVMIAVLTIIGTAHADVVKFFDDSNGKWWMNESEWTKDVYGTVDIGQNGNRLEATSTTEAGGFAGYASKWTLSFDENFSFTVNFHYDPSDTNIGGLALGGMPPDATDDSGIIMYAGNVSGSNKYEWDWMLPTGSGEAVADRAVTDGTLSASYNASLKQMVVSSGEAGVSKTFDFSSFIGPGDNLAVGLGGGSEGAIFSGSEAYLTNFSVTSGTPTPGVAPEPISSALFLLGGAVLAARQQRKKRKA